MPSAVFPVPPFEVPVLAKPDVCVVGGGPAGVAAAVSAGRLGLDVLLIEKYGFCGGATVAGLSGTMCGLYSSGDRPEQIVFGFAEEFRDALARRGGIDKPVPFGRTVLIPHDPLIWKETADDILRGAGVKVLFHTNFIRAYLNSRDKVETILVRGMQGLFAIQSGYVIDASGDAEVVHSLSGTTTFGKDGVVQTPTMIFRLGGVDMKRFLSLDQHELCGMIAEADGAGRYDLPRHHVYLFPMPNGGEVVCNMTRITFPDGRIPSGVDSADMTHAEIEGRRQAREYHRFLRDNIDAFAGSYMTDTGSQVGIRQSRSINGKATLTNDAVLEARKVKGAAAFSAWPIEAHGAGELKIVYLEEDSYDIAFETLIPDVGHNLLVAGRCMSAEHEALASARVTAQCLSMGYAAGSACGLMKRESIDADDLSGVEVAEWMRSGGLKTAREA